MLAEIFRQAWQALRRNSQQILDSLRVAIDALGEAVDQRLLADDVRLTKDLYEYALKKGKLHYKDGSRKVDIAIDTSSWGDANGASLTHTLPF